MGGTEVEGSSPADEAVVPWETMRRLHELTTVLNDHRSLDRTLQAVVDGVVQGVGFGVALVNRVLHDGTFETVAVAGSDAARAELLGRVQAADEFDKEFARADRWGRLRFVPHDRLEPDEVNGWVPDVPISDHPDAWHPLDALFVPLTAPSGELVGMLSVDLPEDGMRPGPQRRQVLEMFAAHAGVAINNARLNEELVREHARLKASELSFRLAFDGAGSAMAMVSVGDDAGTFLRVNDAFAQLAGRPRAELAELSSADIAHPEDRAVIADFAASAASGEQSARRWHMRLVHPDGTQVWVAVISTVVRGLDGAALYAISQFEDVTAERAHIEHLREVARTDPLTGLLHRGALVDHLRRLLAPGSADSVAVLFCDLDDFKRVNDSYGHQAGDRILTSVAARLRIAVRDVDVVARIGGDEFVVVAADIAGEELASLAERVRRTLAEPHWDHEHRPVAVTVSVGVASGSAAAGDDPESLLGRADEAMYDAKAAGKDGYVCADPVQPAGSAASAAGGRVLDRGVGAGEDERLVSVVVPDEVGRGPVGTVHLDDLGGGVSLPDDPSVHVQSVPNGGAHGSSSSAS